VKIKPYYAQDLFAIALSLDPGQQLDPLRVVATYADPDAWQVIHAKDENGNMRAYWSWNGPMIVGYELASHALPSTDTEKK
jgi:hypothetical protein